MFRPLRLDFGAEATADRLVERCEVVARDPLARTPILAQAVLVAIDLKRHHGHLLLHAREKTRLSAVRKTGAAQTVLQIFRRLVRTAQIGSP